MKSTDFYRIMCLTIIKNMWTVVVCVNLLLLPALARPQFPMDFALLDDNNNENNNLYQTQLSFLPRTELPDNRFAMPTMLQGNKFGLLHSFGEGFPSLTNSRTPSSGPKSSSSSAHSLLWPELEHDPFLDLVLGSDTSLKPTEEVPRMTLEDEQFLLDSIDSGLFLQQDFEDLLKPSRTGGQGSKRSRSKQHSPMQPVSQKKSQNRASRFAMRRMLSQLKRRKRRQ